MATYKVIQDIEAEDKFLGPLTLKQFVFGAAGLFFGYLSVYAITQNVSFLLAVFLPPAALGLFLAIPWSREQPTEVWVLAKLRFKIKPRSRIWDQAGLEELVTVTAPKKIEVTRTDGLNQDEVQSRLKALADTIDTRGWATKNIGLNDRIPADNDRLIAPSMMPREVPEIDLESYDDVMDADTTVSENFGYMMQSSSDTLRRESLEKMERVRRGEPVDAAQRPVVNFTPPVADGSPQNGSNNSGDQQLSQQLRNNRSAGDLVNSNLRTLPTISSGSSTSGGVNHNYLNPAPPVQPPVVQPAVTEDPVADAPPVDMTTTIIDDDIDDVTPVEEPQAEMTRAANPAILELAHNNDLDIATIARQAKRDDPDENEVVISLR